MAANARIIYQNLADVATVTASSSASASLAAKYLLTDRKSECWRSVGTTTRLDVLLAASGIVGGVALPFTNLSAAATMRVRMSNEAQATNLLQYPRQFHLSPWLLGDPTTRIRPNVALAPDGMQTMSKLVESPASAGVIQHLLRQDVPGLTAGAVYTHYIYAKAGERSSIFLTVFGGGFAVFNLATGQIVQNGGYACTMKEDPPNSGVYRCAVTAPQPGTGTGRFYFGLWNGANNYAGDGQSGVYIWHGQAVVGAQASSVIPDGTQFSSRASAKHYYDAAGVLRLAAPNEAVTDYDAVTHVSRGLSLEAAATNQISYPRDFTNALWSSVRSFIAPRVASAPDGAMAASKLIEAVANGSHYIAQARTGSNETVTGSLLARAGERTRIRLEWSNYSGASCGAYFDLTNGNVIAVDAVNADYTAPKAWTENCGNGWYRCFLTVTKASVNTVNNFVASLVQAGSVTSYAGDGSSGVFIWHEEINVSSTTASITPDATVFTSRASVKWEFNASGVLTQYAVNAAVTAYDPVSRISRGLSLEPAATNSVRNNTMQGVVAGVPGTLPTNWLMFSVAGIAMQVVGSGAESGIEYVDLRFFGTATAGGNLAIYSERSGITAAAVGQAWDHSVFVRLAAGSLANAAFRMTIDQYDSGGLWAAAMPSTLLPASTAALATQRFSANGVISAASAVSVAPVIFASVVVGAVVDVTLRIGLPQLEQGSVPTSPIKTSSSAVTRAADVSSSPQSTRAADISVSPQVTRPAGYIDAWQSYDYDSGYVTALRGGVRDVFGWPTGQQGVASFGFGGGSCAVKWLPRAQARAVAVDIRDPGNPAGYIEASRLVVGDYWSPVKNMDHGSEPVLVDSTTFERSGAGDQMVTAGTRHDTVSLNFSNFTPEDRAAFVRIQRYCGMVAPVFVSLYPEWSDPLLEADNQVYGRMSSLGAIKAISLGYYGAPMAIESI